MTKFKKIALGICVLVLLLGVGLLLRPYVNRAKTDWAASSAVRSFRALVPTEAQAPDLPPDETEAEAPVPYPELLAAMEAYNQEIYEAGQSGLTDTWSYQAQAIDPRDYGLEDGVVAVLSIPKMDLELPIYLGATAEHLAAGAAHMTQTSMPIGGINTNCVLAGHRGWYGALLFRNIELLEIGDEITITNLWGTLTYKVTEIQVIEPAEKEPLLIRPGRDMVTLLTCHPPGTGGRYRYLVLCDRVTDQAAID